MKRFHQGNASSSNAETIGLLAGLFADKGRELAEEMTSQRPDRVLEASQTLFRTSARAQQVLEEVKRFVQEVVIPNESLFLSQVREGEDRWKYYPEIMEEMKAKAKAAGLWNLWLPQEAKEGPGFSNLEYASMAEAMGQSHIAPEVFNCSAPDTGNMEVLLRYGNQAQKDKWLTPLLEGTIRSCFAMTEPAVVRTISLCLPLFFGFHPHQL